MTVDRGPATVLPALAVWALGGAALLTLDGRVDLASLAMGLVLTSAVASMWLPGGLSALAGAAGVVAFNWAFVPPRHSLAVDRGQHALLLGAMLVVNGIVSALIETRRREADAARRVAEREARLRAWGDTLRDARDPVAHAGGLADLLAAVAGAPAAVWLAGAGEGVIVGQVDADQRAGLQHCQRQARALGPGTGHHEDQPDAYFPLRGRDRCAGAAVLRLPGARAAAIALRPHLQALCDQYGLALERAHAADEERRAREAAQAEGVRNALLTAISHDYRTPLATIIGAASSLRDQGERLAAEPRRRLADSIVDEASRLARLADNTLQLARLDAAGFALRCDWESAEEIVGAVLARVRRRDPEKRVRARLEPALPLLWCDAMLLSQMLENLVDNALKYSPPEAPVEILARVQGEQLMLAVRDRGPGIAPAWRERVFEVFHRGAEPMPGATSVAPTGGAGVGLAVGRAIARAHGGELRLRARAHGGSAFECWLPLRPGPAAPAVREEPAAPAAGA